MTVSQSVITGIMLGETSHRLRQGNISVSLSGDKGVWHMTWGSLHLVDYTLAPKTTHKDSLGQIRISMIRKEAST